MVIPLKDEEVFLEQEGKPVAVIMSYEKYQQLMEELEDLEDALDAIQARTDVEPTISLEDYMQQRQGEPAQSQI